MVETNDGVQVLVLGGRAGVGKTTVAYAVSSRLQELRVAHCHVEGDNLDAAYPKPADDPHGTALTQANLTALWRNYASCGVRRMIYVNTVSVLDPALIVRSVGGSADVVSVLLTGTDETVQERCTVVSGDARSLHTWSAVGEWARFSMSECRRALPECAPTAGA